MYLLERKMIRAEQSIKTRFHNIPAENLTFDTPPKWMHDIVIFTHTFTPPPLLLPDGRFLPEP